MIVKIKQIKRNEVMQEYNKISGSSMFDRLTDIQLDLVRRLLK